MPALQLPSVQMHPVRDVRYPVTPHFSTQHPERDPQHLLPPTPKHRSPSTCIVPWGLIGAMFSIVLALNGSGEAHCGSE